VYRNVLPVSNNQPIKRYEAPMILKGAVTPVFHKTYDPPYTLRDILESEINRLVNTGILKHVTHSQWATPVLLEGTQEGWR
jgi:hypothetical protein